MNTYSKILSKINITNVLKEIINNNVKVPVLDDYNSLDTYWYPHPPCLIPIFLGYGASYKGVVHHFFCDRKDTFIEFFLEQGYFSEIARNEQQLLTLMILSMIMAEDEVTNKTVKFCNEIGYKDLNVIDSFFTKYGDNSKEFDKLIYVKDCLPCKYSHDMKSYTGDFPSSLREINSNQINNACSFEFSMEDYLDHYIEKPLWLDKKENKKNLFEKYVSNNQLKEAWFTLNSKGWLLNDVVDALLILKKKTNNELLHLVSDNWINNWEKSNFKENAYY